MWSACVTASFGCCLAFMRRTEKMKVFIKCFPAINIFAAVLVDYICNSFRLPTSRLVNTDSEIKKSNAFADVKLQGACKGFRSASLVGSWRRMKQEKYFENSQSWGEIQLFDYQVLVLARLV